MKKILSMLLLVMMLSFLAASSHASSPSASSHIIAASHTSAAAPVAKSWYFAEGKVDPGVSPAFQSFFTVANPSNGPCAVDATFDYVFDASGVSGTKTISLKVPANSRYTENANADLRLTSAATLSAIFTVDNGATPTCSGVVVERPMYTEGFHGISSGSDVLGATALNTTWYFADIPTHSAGESFLAILNPGDVAANVIVTYYANGVQVGTPATLMVAPNARGTIEPNADINLPAHVSAIVTSDRNVLVERPSYFVDEYGVSGSADVVGVPSLAPDWLFAEGNTSSGTQENLAIANLDAQPAIVTVLLKSLNGAVWTSDPMTIAPKAQVIWSVNSANVFVGATSEVASEVKSVGANIAVQRQMYTTYSGGNGGQSWQAQGVTDTFGATAGHSAYTFGEGFGSIGFNEWLLVQNPTMNTETITVTLMSMLSHTYTVTFTVAPNSRYTVSVTSLIAQHLAQPGEDARAYAVSMTVQSAGNALFVAERTMYWNAFSTQGAESVVGYSG